MAKFFIGYSRIDSTFARAFVAGLEQQFTKHSFWYDVNPVGGEYWWNVILGKIAEADIFIYLLSDNAVKSTYCQAEFQEARRLRKQIIFVQIRDHTAITGDTSGTRYVDMTAGLKNPRAQEKLTVAIDKQLDRIRRRIRPLSRIPTPEPALPVETPRAKNVLDINTPEIHIPMPTEDDEATRTVPLRVPVSLPQKRGPRMLAILAFGVIVFVVIGAIVTLLNGRV